jgi:hypothetical protein
VEGVSKGEPPGEEPEGAARHATRRVAPLLKRPTPSDLPGRKCLGKRVPAGLPVKSNRFPCSHTDFQ